ncbi:MAG: DUF805 domain-containing protein [Micrococcus sp.]|nr:DUF805 domain-containing protein [Micrococcus sp.]
MPIISALADFYRGYVDFFGRTTRSPCWMVLIVFLVMGTGVQLLFSALRAQTPGLNPAGYVEAPLFPRPFGLTADQLTAAYWPIVQTLFVLHLTPLLAMLTRRLRDAGLSPVWLLLGLIPGLGQLAVAILALQPTDPRVPAGRGERRTAPGHGDRLAPRPHTPTPTPN